MPLVDRRDNLRDGLPGRSGLAPRPFSGDRSQGVVSSLLLRAALRGDPQDASQSWGEVWIFPPLAGGAGSVVDQSQSEATPMVIVPLGAVLEDHSQSGIAALSLAGNLLGLVGDVSQSSCIIQSAPLGTVMQSDDSQSIGDFPLEVRAIAVDRSQSSGDAAAFPILSSPAGMEQDFSQAIADVPLSLTAVPLDRSQTAADVVMAMVLGGDSLDASQSLVEVILLLNLGAIAHVDESQGFGVLSTFLPIASSGQDESQGDCLSLVLSLNLTGIVADFSQSGSGLVVDDSARVRHADTSQSGAGIESFVALKVQGGDASQSGAEASVLPAPFIRVEQSSSIGVQQLPAALSFPSAAQNGDTIVFVYALYGDPAYPIVPPSFPPGWNVGSLYTEPNVLVGMVWRPAVAADATASPIPYQSALSGTSVFLLRSSSPALFDNVYSVPLGKRTVNLGLYSLPRRGQRHVVIHFATAFNPTGPGIVFDITGDNPVSSPPGARTLGPSPTPLHVAGKVTHTSFGATPSTFSFNYSRFAGNLITGVFSFYV